MEPRGELPLRHTTAALVGIGILCGAAWAAALRAYMIELAGAASAFDWWGTLGAILVPGAIVGGLLGWADAIRRHGGRRGWRWLALSPLLFAIAPMLLPGALVDFLTQGLGGDAVAVALMGIAGGYALSRRGPSIARIVCGILSAFVLVALAIASPFIGGPRLALTEPRGVWLFVLASSLGALLILAASIPHRMPVSAETARH